MRRIVLTRRRTDCRAGHTLLTLLLCCGSALSVSAGMVDKLHVNVDITSDVVCPWCWVGKRHLDSAIETLSGEFEFHVHWKPFLLNPGMPDEGEPLEQHLRNKYGDAAIQRFLSDDSPLKQAGRAVGISFNPNRMVVPTKKAHILLAHSANEGKQHRLHEHFFKAYFADGLNITDEGVLRGLVEKTGMDGEKAMAALTNPELVSTYEEEVREAVRKGITGVPHFEIYLRDRPGMKQAVSGAQPIETLIALFKRLRLLPKV